MTSTVEMLAFIADSLFLHQPERAGRRTYCDHDGREWPCQTIQLAQKYGIQGPWPNHEGA